uniref:Ankyrin repeat domain-containing protein 34B-like n=1 Tax=Gouania willdenowi TaxID=441366 RepID=A0A8C5EV37_GOUWI
MASESGTDGSSLLKAVYLSRLRLTRLLLEGGAYINESNERGETPLMVACRTRYNDSQSVPKHKMVRYLLENGADPNIQDKTGKTALMHAVLEQSGSDILLLLLSSGADPMLEDHCGVSALVHAVKSGERHTLGVLMDACRAKGKEVIIISTNTLPSGCRTKHFLDVPPPPDLHERMHYSAGTPHDFPLQTPPPQSSSASTSPLTGRRESQGLGSGSLSSWWNRSAAEPKTSLQEGPPASGRRTLGRKMSYDSAAASLYSTSHPNLLHDAATVPYFSDGIRQLHSLQDVVRCRSVGFDHYSSDSQLPQFPDKTSVCATQKVECHKADSAAQRRGATALERRGSGALLLDHIAQTRPGFLPPLKPQTPIPDIGVPKGALSVLLNGSKRFLPCAPAQPRDLSLKKTLWRRHSMQSEQIKQLADFGETSGL